MAVREWLAATVKADMATSLFWQESGQGNQGQAGVQPARLVTMPLKSHADLCSNEFFALFT